MRKYFLTGVITLLPITVTVLVFIFLIDFLTAPFDGLISFIFDELSYKYTNVYQHKELVIFLSRVFVLILLFFITLLLGYLGRKFLIRSFISFTHWIFLKLPVVRSIYRVSKEITLHLFDAEVSKRFFKRTVLTKFPHNNALALGFQTGFMPKEAEGKLGVSIDEMETIFVPTSPHPISGFVLITRKTDSSEIPLSAEEVFKVLVSCGLYEPPQTPTEPK